MVDIVSRQKRSEMMSRIRGQDTAPEIAVRSMLHRMGYRFRLHRRDLPGRPDVVLNRFRMAVFVHGCFWHRHRGCRLAYMPKTRKRFWLEKFKKNIERDRKVQRELRRLGWKVVVIWECKTAEKEKLRNLLKNRLDR